ncbi:MAG: hypothetical protein HRU13_12090 [Phycisphaerales bacterium]|nr:hypothetical protein [Phycisphaerales bacterium]
MTRPRLLALAAIPLALGAAASMAPSQHQAPRAPQAATQYDHVGWSGPISLVNEIQRRRADAKEAELERAKADGDETPSVTYLRASRAIWEDDRLRDAPSIIEAGKDILNIHRYRHDQQRRLDMCVEILAVIDANRERWLAMVGTASVRERMAERIDGQTITILSGMQGAGNLGRPHIQMAALERLIALAPDAQARENFIMQRDDLRYRMKLGLFGPEDPPEQWRIPPRDERDRGPRAHERRGPNRHRGVAFQGRLLLLAYAATSPDVRPLPAPICTVLTGPKTRLSVCWASMA